MYCHCGNYVYISYTFSCINCCDFRYIVLFRFLLYHCWRSLLSLLYSLPFFSFKDQAILIFLSYVNFLCFIIGKFIRVALFAFSFFHFRCLLNGDLFHSLFVFFFLTATCKGFIRVAQSVPHLPPAVILNPVGTLDWKGPVGWGCSHTKPKVILHYEREWSTTSLP